MNRPLAAVIPALAAACGSSSTAKPDAALDSDVQLVIGSAELDGTGFVAVEDQQDVLLVSGAQGGFHVWTGIRILGATGTLNVQRSARRIRDNALILADAPFIVEIPEDQGDVWWQSEYAAPSFMCPSPLGIDLVDEPIELTATLLTTAEVTLVTVTLAITPRCPSDEQGEFCFSICRG